jgi:N-acetylneuraminate lyase
MKAKTEKKSRKLFRGIVPALYTAYNKNGSVNYDTTARLAEWLVDKGAAGFYLCGSTGEGLFLTLDERRRILETVSKKVGKRVPLMVHVGTMATRDAVELAKHAADQAGVVAISSLPPQYYSYTVEDEIAHLSAIATATEKPFFPYLFQATVARLGTANLVPILSQIPQIGGIKAFVSDLAVHQFVIRQAPAWEVLHGYDECLSMALVVPGIDGAIGSTYNTVPELAIGMYQVAKAGDVKTLQRLQLQFNNYWMPMPGVKIAMFGRLLLGQRGFPMGAPRAPLALPTAAMVKSVAAAHRKSGFDITRGGL